MKIINIESTKNTLILKELNAYIQGEITESFGESILTFNNSLGKGTIRSISFDLGVSLLDYNVNFNEDIKIVLRVAKESPIEFIFVSEGNLKFTPDSEENPVLLERYQNVIISNKSNAKNTFYFPRNIDIKVNIIELIKKEFQKGKNNSKRLDSLQNSILSIFRGGHNDEVFQHIGNYNIKIADHVKELNATDEKGLVKSLTIEGQLNLILALQLLEHTKHENKPLLPDSLSKEDIKKIHKLCDYILDNISETTNIEHLSKQAGMSPKKLQIGFRLLYNKSINEYMRQIRLELAGDYIKNTDLSVSEIVYKIGYKSRSYFSKVFYEGYGILPKEYKDKVKNKAN
ncbi:AraC family transcriptional regulator [Lacinutrix neustonica]|uniref:AraC family transcriptional regulator n=1 Tax=Lacinutrix neustonica TaxID=2980107 RepID=A0A9E8MZS4_9FLAO|nr:AraC family transcriptional regulator [Lacinutrix neustonica]WAC03255.1 AraC family transcriptional regulator [Lacinutrix neustonica]